MTVPAISIDDLRKSYRKAWRAQPVMALRGVTLNVEPGEAFGFIGANGAGKTTTIKILMGLIQATQGQATLFGTPVGDPAARLRWKLVGDGGVQDRVGEETASRPGVVVGRVQHHALTCTELENRLPHLAGRHTGAELDAQVSG